MKRKRCGDYFPHKEGYLPDLCCISCHEDEDYGYYLGSAPDDNDSEVCCAVREELRKQALTRPPESRR